MKKISALLCAAVLLCFVITAYAASSASCSLSYLNYKGTGTLTRDAYTGTVTATTTMTSGDGVWLAMHVFDRTSGSHDYPFKCYLKSSKSLSYTPPYMYDDTLSARSMHAIHSAVSSVGAVSTKTLEIP